MYFRNVISFKRNTITTMSFLSLVLISNNVKAEVIQSSTKSYYTITLEEFNRMSNDLTRIYSLASIAYVQDQNGKLSEMLTRFTPPTGPMECELSDVKNSYKNYYFLEVTESSDEFSNIYEGITAEGKIVKKTYTYCYAN